MVRYSQCWIMDRYRWKLLIHQPNFKLMNANPYFLLYPLFGELKFFNSQTTNRKMTLTNDFDNREFCCESRKIQITIILPTVLGITISTAAQISSLWQWPCKKNSIQIEYNINILPIQSLECL